MLYSTRKSGVDVSSVLWKIRVGAEIDLVVKVRGSCVSKRYSVQESFKGDLALQAQSKGEANRVSGGDSRERGLSLCRGGAELDC